jgi:hypothetical protein
VRKRFDLDMWATVILNLSRLEMWPGIRRGLLLRCGIAWCLLGVIQSEGVVLRNVPGASLTFFPLLAGLGWVLTGLFVIYGALARDRTDDLAWGVLTFMPSVTAISFLVSGIIGLASLLIPGAEHQGSIASFAWAAFWSLIWSIVRAGAHITPSPTIHLREPP